MRWWLIWLLLLSSFGVHILPWQYRLWWALISKYQIYGEFSPPSKPTAVELNMVATLLSSHYTILHGAWRASERDIALFTLNIFYHYCFWPGLFRGIYLWWHLRDGMVVHRWGVMSGIDASRLTNQEANSHHAPRVYWNIKSISKYMLGWLMRTAHNKRLTQFCISFRLGNI